MKAAIIGASAEALHTIQEAQQLGITVAAFDGNKDAAGLLAADESFVVDISDENKTIEAVKKSGADFVLTVPIGRYLTTIGAVNEALGMPGITKGMARSCTDKYLFHKKMEEEGLRNCACYSLPEEKEQSVSVTFPAIVKPRFGSGSRGIHYVESKEQLETVLQEIDREPYIVEECVSGEEYGVDAAVIDGVFYMIFLRRKVNTPLPNRQAVAYYAVWEEDVFYKEAYKYMKKTVQVLGLQECLMHADLIRSERGPFAIELSARPSGHNLHNLFTPLATGVDMAKEYIRYRIGKPYSFEPDKKEKLSIHYFDMQGKVTHVPDEKEAALTGADVIRWNCNIMKGDVLGSVSDGHSVMGRGYFILRENKKEEPAKQALAIKSLFQMRSI